MDSSLSHLPGQEQALSTNRTEILETTCCIVGGGPAGAFLALLLARQGIQVLLLEARSDFDREFRGDTIHPAILEIVDELNLSEQLLQLAHTRATRVVFHTHVGPVPVNDFSRLKSRYPFEILLPQARFINFLVDEARRYPNFKLVMDARVEQLHEQDGTITGVRFRGKHGMVDVHALLTVGADGRFSKLRRLAQLSPVTLMPPIDFLWFNLPRTPSDPLNEAVDLYLGAGLFIALLDRADHWQVGCAISKGTYKQMREADIVPFRTAVASCVPWLADRVDLLDDWKQTTLLSIESSRLRRWYRPGLLMIGDAAHVMSPIGGVGINLAIQDAVAAANRLTKPLRLQRLQVADLAAVQRDRLLRTRLLQGWTGFLQKQMGKSLAPNKTFSVPPVARLASRMPLLGILPDRLTAYGGWREHVRYRSQINHNK